jgi:hypothetical protein
MTPDSLTTAGMVVLRLASLAVLAGLAGGCAHAAASHSADQPRARPVMSGGASWLAGRGGSRLDAVNADAARLSAALRRNGRSTAARQAAARLSTDASAARGGPMPLAGADVYRAGLRDMRAAGAAVLAGRAGDAARLIASGTVDLAKVAELADS